MADRAADKSKIRPMLIILAVAALLVLAFLAMRIGGDEQPNPAIGAITAAPGTPPAAPAASPTATPADGGAVAE